MSRINCPALQARQSDFFLYDTHYAERYLGTKLEAARVYSRADAVTHVARLKSATLLLIHGMPDDDVTFDRSTRLMAALQSQGIAFETRLTPG